MDRAREIERIEINMREARKMLKIQIDKFGKEMASDYRIKIPEGITEASKEDFHLWVMSVKDKIIAVEEKLTVKSFFYVILNSYLSSLEQLKKVEKQAEITK